MLVGLQGWALETDQRIGTTDQFPPALNRGGVGHAVIGPSSLILRVFEPVFDPGARAIGVAHGPLDFALQIGHDRGSARSWQRLWVSREQIKADTSPLPKDDLLNIAGLLLIIGEDPFKRTPVRVTDPLPFR